MNDLVNRIAEGRANLLGIEDICQRLGISRSTFDRWQRESTRASQIASTMGLGDALGHAPKIGRVAASGGIGRFGTGPAAAALASAIGLGDQDDQTRTPFPPPDIRIGASPKWEMETFKAWLRENVRQA